MRRKGPRKSSFIVLRSASTRELRRSAESKKKWRSISRISLMRNARLRRTAISVMRSVESAAWNLVGSAKKRLKRRKRRD